MKYSKLLPLAFCFATSFTVQAHDVHLSVTEISQDKNDLEVTIRIFYDDLLAVFGLEAGQELPADYSNADELIESYINQHFEIKVNGLKMKLLYDESTAMMPAIWINLRILDIDTKDLKEIEITNNIFTEQFSDQLNMVNIDINQLNDSKALDSGKTSIIFKPKR